MVRCSLGKRNFQLHVKTNEAESKTDVTMINRCNWFQF